MSASNTPPPTPLPPCGTQKRLFVKLGDKAPRIQVASSAFRYQEALALTDDGVFVSRPSVKALLRGNTPLLSIRLTHLSGGGCVLAIGMSHGIGDADAFHRLVHQWARACRGESVQLGTPPSTALSFTPEWTELERQPQGVLANRLKEAGFWSLRGWDQWEFRRLVYTAQRGPRTRLRFLRRELEAMRQHALAESGEDWLSTHEVICGFLATELCRLEGLSGLLPVGMSVNVRREASNVLPADYFGNAVGVATCHVDVSACGSHFGWVAAALHRELQRTSPASLLAQQRLMNDAAQAGIFSWPFSFERPFLSFNNQVKFAPRTVDFGTGPAGHVFPQWLSDVVLLMQGPAEAIDVYVSTPRHTELLQAAWQERLHRFAAAPGAQSRISCVELR